MKINEYVLIPVIFLINLVGLCPSIYVGDSSIFSAASFSLGSTHPPGYPLFIVLGKLLTFIPLGNVAMKTNLVSAISGTLACLLVYRASMMLTKNVYASWAAAIICGISPVFFVESLKAEAYTLNSFLAMIVFILGLLILEGKSLFKNGMLGFFVIGLGMGNHHTMGFMGIVFLMPIAIRWKELRLRWILYGIIAFLLGFSVNAFLYLRSVAMVHSGGLMVYSYAGSWHDFVRVLLRQDYKGSNASTPQSLVRGLTLGVSWFYGLKNSLLCFVYPNTKPVLPFVLAGFFGLRKKKGALAYFVFAFIVWFLLLGRMVFSSKDLGIKDVDVVSPYFLPAVPILYCLAAVGFATALGWAGKLSYRLLHRVASYALVFLPFALLPYSYGLTDTNKAPIAYDYGRDMLSVLPVNSLLLNYSDNSMFITFYMRSVERFREDVLVIDTGGREDVYGMESSPEWKYGGLYPFFYKARKSSVKEINAEFAEKGKLFSNNPTGFTETVEKKYHYYPYIFSVGLYPVDMDAEGAGRFKKRLSDVFKANYEKTAYEHAETVSPANDYLVEELVTQYSMNTMIYADFIKREGMEAKGNKLYARAFSIQYPERYLWPYLYFLLGDGRRDEAFALIRSLKSAPREYGKFAELLEQRAISAVRVEKR